MRRIDASKIKETIAELCIRSNIHLRPDVVSALRRAYSREKARLPKEILKAIIENSLVAQKEKLAICQDTGLPCVFAQIGQDVKIEGSLKKAINDGVKLGYKTGSLRNSIVSDPLKRGGPEFIPCVIHIDLVKGNKLRLIVLPKGFGCENKTALKMFKPTAEIKEIKKFIVETIKTAGPDACPPYVVGVGIGGTADYAVFLAKKALLETVDRRPSTVDRRIARLERELLIEINKLNIGPMGLGGKTTALAVNIETYPTHIAGLPVAVNISCHALRSAAKTL